MENTVRFFSMNVAFYWMPFLWEISCLSKGSRFWGQYLKWSSGRYLCAGWAVTGVGEPHLLLWAFNQLGIQGGSLNMLTDKNQNSFHPPLHPPTPPIRCSIYEHMFSSLWEQQVWVEPAPVRNRTGERTAEECFPMTGYLPGPSLLIWARAKGDRHRQLLMVGETGAVRSFDYQPIFSLRPLPIARWNKSGWLLITTE